MTHQPETFDQIFQDLIKLRRETKSKVKDTLTEHDFIEAQHAAKYGVNRRFGSFMNKANNPLYPKS